MIKKFAACALVLGVTPLTGTVSAVASNAPRVHLIGTARQLRTVIRLTSSDQFGAVGAMWTSVGSLATKGFTITLRFRITPRQPPNNPWWDGGDGMAVVIQQDPRGPHAVGGGGQNLGYAGIRNSVAVELDTIKNLGSQFSPPSSIGDPNGNHISVQTRGHRPNSADERYSLGVATSIPNLTSGAVHTLTVTYGSGRLSVGFDHARSLIVAQLHLRSLFGPGQTWVGVTAATGDAAETHDVVGLTTDVQRRRARLASIYGSITGGARFDP